MPTLARRAAIAAADASCPRCAAPRRGVDRYCLECGLHLPAVRGAVPALRRAWLARFGWYPGDWVWLTLATLVVAVAGTAAAIVVDQRRHRPPTVVLTAPGPAPAAPARRATHPPTRPNGRFAWPAGVDGWTVVLISYPATTGRAAALATATRAAAKHLPQVGVLASGSFASLQPGYDVVFSGVYSSEVTADGAVQGARQAGFGGAYSRQIVR